MSGSCRLLFKLHLQSDASELTFVRSSGGHKVGIVNEQSIGRGCAQEFRAICSDPWNIYLNEKSGKFSEPLMLIGLAAGMSLIACGCLRAPA
ncbi:hypothetical protein [Candidatus Accumulibacter sp. ACC003]|uniref:hypothetical protein n=1 Tax=Candidatus Accumulibacter sp. ACC003 TaxID=2823334 RepID=UPI0025B8B8CE|nr:hypothetical protein [Candidatus Accumulibacter sp. ACC003]